MPRALGQTEGNLKNTPCGQSTDGRTTDRVNVFAPGETITLKFNEFINHPSYYRVAFDPDGDTFPMRTGVPANTTETTAQAEAAEQAVFQGSGSILLAVVPEVNGTASSATVTLPNMQCENCTLQLIEFMYDKGDPQHGYYQCADIALRGGMTGDGNPPAAAADAGAPGMMQNAGGAAGAPSNADGMTGQNSGAMGQAPGTGMNLGTAPAMTGDRSGNGATDGYTGTSVNNLMPSTGTAMGATPSATGAPAMSGASGSDSSGGCSFGTGAPASSFAGLAFAGLLGTLVSRRRSRSAK